MAVHVTCICGEEFALKNEWAGRRVTCPVCKSPIDVPELSAPIAVSALARSRQGPESAPQVRIPTPAPVQRPIYAAPRGVAGPAQRSAYGSTPMVDVPVPTAPTIRGDLMGMYHHPLFRRDLFFVTQRMFQINSKYHIYDEMQFTIGFVERPSHVIPMLLAILAALTILTVGYNLIAPLADSLDTSNPALGIVGIVLLGGLVVATAAFIGMTINPLRHSTIYQDESKTYPLLRIRQDTKYQVLHTNFTVTMPDGEILGYLRKPLVYNLLRKRWNWFDADGTLVCIAREDSLILSLVRRFMGDLGYFIRTNFHLFHPETEIVIGEFNRKLTIQDRYVLDLRQDPEHYLDRRVALALGIMLDTGERR